MNRIVHLILTTALSVLLLTLAATVARAQAPTVTITSPEAGATVEAPVTVEWSVDGAEIVAAGEATEREQAHFHLFVDKEPDIQEGVPFPGGDPQIIHTASTSAELTDLAPGEHTVTLVLGYSDHSPWMPAVTDSVTFSVGGAAPETMPETGRAANGWLIAATALGLALLAAGALLRRRVA